MNLDANGLFLRETTCTGSEGPFYSELRMNVECDSKLATDSEQLKCASGCAKLSSTSDTGYHLRQLVQPTTTSLIQPNYLSYAHTRNHEAQNIISDILVHPFARPLLSWPVCPELGIRNARTCSFRNQRFKNINIRHTWNCESRQAACRRDPRYRRTFLRTW